MKAFPKYFAYVWIAAALASAVGEVSGILPPNIAAVVTLGAAMASALTHSIPQSYKVPAFFGFLTTGATLLATAVPVLTTGDHPLLSAGVAVIVGAISTVLNAFVRNVQGAVTPAK